jgi:hypothetical protein
MIAMDFRADQDSRRAAFLHSPDLRPRLPSTDLPQLQKGGLYRRVAAAQ